MNVAIQTMTPESVSPTEPTIQSVLYSTYGYLHPKKSVWRIPVQGRVFSERVPSFSQRILVRGLKATLRVTPDALQRQFFQERVHGFIVHPEKGSRIRLWHEAEAYRIRQRSRGSGLFQGRIEIPRQNGAPSNHCECLTIRTNDDLGEATGRVFLAGSTGVSIVTDIDDTIKITDVTSRSRMLSRTFLEAFEPIAGMADVYRHWAEQDALFHYVSSSPWQIYSPLERFLREHGFPEGSMHLKWFRIRDEILKRWRIIRRKSKIGVIGSMIKRMPYRKFLLVGDSGERDPEIYAKLAKKFPCQIIGLVIRDLEARPIDGKRYAKLLKRCGPVPLKIFREPDEIIDTLEVIDRDR
jgi:phosphatidate phosphatase APP1